MAKFRLFLYTRLFDAIIIVLMFSNVFMNLTQYFFIVEKPREYALLKALLGSIAGLLVLCRLIDLTVPLDRHFEKNIFREDEDQHGNHPGSR